MTDIYLVRHGETESNLAGLWQGATDSPLTATGRIQVSRLADRLGARRFDAVVTSDLGRAVATAAAITDDYTIDPAWREPDLGAWEGLTAEEVRAHSPDALAAFVGGADVQLGGAERLSDAADRLTAAYRRLAAALGPDGSALVVTHGLAVAVLTGTLLRTRRPNPLALPGNTGIVHLEAGDDDRLIVHNDVTHLVDPPISHARGTEVVFIRHGETVGNIERRWQGQQDGELTDVGREQAKGVVEGLPRLDALYTSKLGRAVETAEIIGDGLDMTPNVLDGVEEFDFGSWEGLTREQIRRRDPDNAARLFDRGEDIIRGGSGETWSRLRDRVTAAVTQVAGRHEGQRIGIVSHGAATRAFVNNVLDLDYPARWSIASIRNTAYARCQLAEKTTRILDWNIAPHLEG